MKRISRGQTATAAIEATGYLLGIEPEPGSASAIRLLMRLKEGGFARVRVSGILASLCKNELRFGDLLGIEGTLRRRSSRAASGALSIVRELDALMITPIHPGP